LAFDFENVAIQVLDVVLRGPLILILPGLAIPAAAALSTSITHVTLVLLTVVLICGPPATGSATMVRIDPNIGSHAKIDIVSTRASVFGVY
jgi:hypothetical protein